MDSRAEKQRKERQQGEVGCCGVEGRIERERGCDGDEGRSR